MPPHIPLMTLDFFSPIYKLFKCTTICRIQLLIRHRKTCEGMCAVVSTRGQQVNATVPQSRRGCCNMLCNPRLLTILGQSFFECFFFSLQLKVASDYFELLLLFWTILIIAPCTYWWEQITSPSKKKYSLTFIVIVKCTVSVQDACMQKI